MRQLITVCEAELKMGLSQEALEELDASLRAALPPLLEAQQTLNAIAAMAPLRPEMQARVQRVTAIIPRLQRLDKLKNNPRADLLDDTLTACTSAAILLRKFNELFVLNAQQNSLLATLGDTQTRCHKCLKIVGVGWGD